MNIRQKISDIARSIGLDVAQSLARENVELKSQLGLNDFAYDGEVPNSFDVSFYKDRNDMWCCRVNYSEVSRIGNVESVVFSVKSTLHLFSLMRKLIKDLKKNYSEFHEKEQASEAH